MASTYHQVSVHDPAWLSSSINLCSLISNSSFLRNQESMCGLRGWIPFFILAFPYPHAHTLLCPPSRCVHTVRDC
jgi:hypothetical protein